MATVAQILANRANARRSTGPRTPEGKARSSQNNRRYGFRSAHPESPSPADHPELAQLLHDLRLDVLPQNPAEDCCCLDFATAVFQLRLLAQAEVEALSPHADDPVTLVRKGWTFARYRSRPQRLFYQSLQRLDLLRTPPQPKMTRPNPISPLAPERYTTTVILLLAAAIAGSATIADWVPARWPSADPQSLDLLAHTPINCLLLEPDHATAALAEPAAKRGIATLVVLRPGGDTLAAARKALENQLTGVVLQGDFDEAAVRVLRDSLSGSKAVVIEMPPRRSLRPTASMPVLATYQSVWPGIPIAPNGAAKAGPTGTPWVNTNTGFLLFARAWTDAPVWVANAPPPDQVLKVENYLQAICDAGVLGARWVLSLDPDFSRRLLARDAPALADWKRIAAHLRYFEEHKEWRALTAHRGMTVIQDADSGALVSGGLLDMIAVKHTPVRVVPRQRLSEDMVRGSRVLLNLEAPLLNTAQKAVVTQFTHSGGLLLTSPPEVKMPALRDDQITIEEQELKEIEVLWRDINQIIWHQSLGAKPYHAAGMLSRTLTSEDGKRVILHLVNYTNYPVENVTVRFPATFRRARLLTPEAAPKDLEIYEMEKTTAVDIDQVPVCATIIVEQ